MPVSHYSFYGRSCIGIYFRVTDRFVICPESTMDEDVKLLLETFKVDTVVKTTVYKSDLLGIFTVANSRGILLSPLVGDDEFERIKASIPGDIRVDVLPTKWTAIGNFLLVNDLGCISGLRLSREQVRVISDTLDIEVETGSIENLPYTGSLAVATNRGVLVDPMILSEEEDLIRNLLKVPVYKGTVNYGSRLIKIGVVANSYGLLVSDNTRGSELARVTEAFRIEE
ncbi:MAG: translation initiation factor IF-6 [Candidatus Bathyarchaeia archaeon]